MVTKMYNVEQGIDFFQSVSRSLLNSEEEASLFGHVFCCRNGPLVRLNGKINANVYQNLLFSLYEHLPMKIMLLACHIAKRVKKFLDDKWI